MMEKKMDPQIDTEMRKQSQWPLNAQKVLPKESTIDVKGKNIRLIAAPHSFNVVRVKMWQ